MAEQKSITLGDIVQHFRGLKLPDAEQALSLAQSEVDAKRAMSQAAKDRQKSGNGKAKKKAAKPQAPRAPKPPATAVSEPAPAASDTMTFGTPSGIVAGQ